MKLDHHDITVLTFLLVLAAVLGTVEYLLETTEPSRSVIDGVAIFSVGWGAYLMGTRKAP